MFGVTPKLMDFGLATTEHISTDFGCGSTFYLSPGMWAEKKPLPGGWDHLTPSDNMPVRRASLGRGAFLFI
jgi:hypothetical protein